MNCSSAVGRLRSGDPCERAQEAEVRLGIAGMWLVSPDVRVHAGREALKLDLPEHLRLAHMAKLAYNLVAGRGQRRRRPDCQRPWQPAGALTGLPGSHSR